MGWDVSSEGFKIVLSADVPKVVEAHLGADVAQFLSAEGLAQEQLNSYLCHPGGPKVMQAIQSALNLDGEALALTRHSLAEWGNLSSASVLMILQDAMEKLCPEPGHLALLMAMGPGFCSELVLLEW